MSLGLYRKITSLCLDFAPSADVTSYLTSCLLEMAWRRVGCFFFLQFLIELQYLDQT